MTSFTDCPVCMGSGHRVGEPCFECGGSGMVEDDDDDDYDEFEDEEYDDEDDLLLW